MPKLELTAGTIAYEDSGGDGPPIVFCHGLLMNGAIWGEVVGDLGGRFRCVRPTLPMGAHRIPMRRDADLSLRGQARLFVDLLDALELEGATLVFNDWCGAQVIVAERWDARVAGLVLASCETFDNYPPGVPGRLAALSAALPGGFLPVLWSLRIKALRRLPMTFGRMSHRPVPDELFASWLESALTMREVRRDLEKYAGDTKAGRKALEAANPSLRDFTKPVLVAWAADDRVMPIEAGRRLAASFPNSRFIEIPESRTLIPIDQPHALATEIGKFAAEQAE
jgi:pimeloyl-ACP methyl ester carboxylesterase